jgi:ribosomal protein L3
LSKFAEFKSEEVSAENSWKRILFEAFGHRSYIDVTGTTKGKGFAGVEKRTTFRWSSFSRFTSIELQVLLVTELTPGKVFQVKENARSYG